MNTRTFLLSTVLLALTGSAATAQARAQMDSTARYFAKLAASTNKNDKALLQGKLYALLKSKKEEDWLMARRYFYQLQSIPTADSITAAAKVAFPNGAIVRDEKVSEIYDEKDPIKKEEKYKAWVKRFPPAKLGSDRIVYDYARNAVSSAYADADNVKKAVMYANMIETPIWKGEGFAGAATRLKGRGHTKEALELFLKARAVAHSYLGEKKNEQGAAFAAMGFTGYTTAIAEIYLEQKNYPEALRYSREAHDSSKTIRGNVNALYAKALIALGKEKEAFDIIDEAVKEGHSTPEMKTSLKALYVKVKGSNAGFDEYMEKVSKAFAAKLRKDMAKQMINQPAPDFTLKDVDGNAVTLDELKGKVVILDFWATWCGPCKRSFPAMKMAVEKYKNNPDVKFLFIHTWEKEKGAADSAKAYMVRNNFPFQVLMDLKNDKGVNPVLEAYKVTAIPTKFVVDRKGNMRFRFTGASPSEEAAVEEIAAMVELVDAGNLGNL
jgi:thiol-disulfide isomerase/thioredoxin